jgi:hypothetical protein
MPLLIESTRSGFRRRSAIVKEALNEPRPFVLAWATVFGPSFTLTGSCTPNPRPRTVVTVPLSPEAGVSVTLLSAPAATGAPIGTLMASVGIRSARNEHLTARSIGASEGVKRDLNSAVLVDDGKSGCRLTAVDGCGVAAEVLQFGGNEAPFSASWSKRMARTA